jgi:PBP1b-binding outer membrane lipoprotein LpoB
MKHSALLLTCAASLLLSGCVSRQHADTKLAEACAAGAAAFLEEREKSEGLEKQTASESAKMGIGHRDVAITLKINDGFATNSKEYSCTFAEEFGALGMVYTAAITQIKLGDKIIGQDGLEIIGTPEELEKLNAAVAGVLNK